LRQSLSEVIKERVYRDILDKATRGPLPLGTVTILFTDVEGSSDLVRKLGDAAAHSLIRGHDQLIRDAVGEHGGTEVERAGDSFMVAFTTARQAAACAQAIQRGLAESPVAGGPPIVVRIGMDTGEVISEEKGYFGSTVFRASRISELARGGRILASEASKVLASQAGFRFTDLGEHDLKGLGEGHRVFELVGEGPAGEAPKELGEGARKALGTG
jgi:eukaryotic-like serine/threonine-protein kinase